MPWSSDLSLGVLRRTTFAWLCALLCGGTAYAQEITLSSPDGGVVLTGALLDFDGEFYRIDTEFGALTVNGAGVTCAGAACPDPAAFVAELKIAGPERFMSGLAPALLRGFADAKGYALDALDDGGFALTDETGGSEVARVSFLSAEPLAARELLLDGSADMALGYGGAGPGSVSRQIVAMDAIVPLVSAQNPLTAIALEDLDAVLSGDVRAWADLGGPDAPIALRLPDDASPEIGFLKEKGLTIASGLSTDVTDVIGDTAILSLAPLSLAGSLRPLDLIGPCGMRAPVTNEAIATELYPLTLPVELTLGPSRLPRFGRAFLAFAVSEDAQPIVAKAGFVDQSITGVAFSEQAGWLADAITRGADGAGLATLQRLVLDLRGSDRLTLAFRFETGTSALDIHSRSNVARLARVIEDGRFDDHDIIVAGFSDGAGAADVNQRLSRQRADVVRRRLLDEVTPPQKTLRERIVARGYGESAPIACDDVAWGRQLNRRVEIWVRQR